MKILAISGGTKNGNNDAMAREALMGAAEAGAEIEFIRLLDLDLKPCTGCVACVNSLMQGGRGSCVIKDDFNWIADKVLDADGIIFVMPIFECAAPGIMNVLQDRIAGPAYDVGINIIATNISKETGKGGPDPRRLKKKAVSFISIGGSDWNCKVSSDMNTVAMSASWTVIDDKIFPWSKSAVMNDDTVRTCHEIGYNTAVAAGDIENARFLGDPGVCPLCHCRNFYFSGEGKAICEVCGMTGELDKTDAGYIFNPDEGQEEYAHTLLPGKMHHMDDIYHYESTLNEQKKTPEYKQRMARYNDFIEASLPTK